MMRSRILYRRLIDETKTESGGRMRQLCGEGRVSSLHTTYIKRLQRNSQKLKESALAASKRPSEYAGWHLFPKVEVARSNRITRSNPRF